MVCYHLAKFGGLRCFSSRNVKGRVTKMRGALLGKPLLET